MSVATAIYEWRLPGCGEDCQPRRHDPLAHEAYGARQERERDTQRYVRSGSLVFDRASLRATVRGEECRLTTRERLLLLTLADHAGKLVAYEDIGVRVLGEDWEHAERRVLLNNLNTHRGRLRKALGEAGYLVVTVPNIGMRLEMEPPL